MKLAKPKGQAEGRIMDAVEELAAGASVEIAPRQILGVTPLSRELPTGSRIYVPFLPNADFGETIQACGKLVSDGFEAVPHIPARAVKSRDQLRECLAALQETGVGALLLIAGDRDRPAGPYTDTIGIFESGMLEEHGFHRLGVAGHPEGHPVADIVALDHALRFKLEYARATGTDIWIVSQFAFGSAQIVAWLERLRSKGFEIPVHVGIPGPASLKTLFSYAAYCGVEASARVLARRPGAARLLARWTPDGLIQDLAHYRLTHPDARLQGLHFYSFGGVAETAQWLRAHRPATASPREIRTSGAA